MSLPQPDADALEASRELERRIGASIDAAGGWIGFDEFMRRALYEPGLGYYAGPLRRFGRAGDFVTAPELSPLFARALAVQIEQWFDHCAPVVVEFGAGSGALAAELLAELQARGAVPREYLIVELSAPLREAQRRAIGERVPTLLPRVRWLDALPGSIDGVVLGNELLDAMPVTVFECTAGSVLACGIARGEVGGLAWATRPASPALADSVRSALAGADGLGPRPARYRSEIGLQARAWVATVGRAIERGALLLLDYGFPAREYYHPQRAEGTLVAHYRHRVHGDVLRWPGLQDLSAHVDFTAIASAAGQAGLQLLGYTSQARLLLNCGLLELLAQEAGGVASAPRSADDVRRLGAVQALISEAEMGELVKAIAFGRGLPDDAIGFVRGDRREALAC